MQLPVPPELFAETVRALPGSGYRGANVTIPHKQAALALADEPSDAARGDRRGQHADLRADGAIHGDNTDAAGLLAALGGAVRADARSCWAPAAPRARPRGRCARRARR